MAESQTTTAGPKAKREKPKSINLKNNIYLTLLGTPIPGRARKIVATSIPYMAEYDSSWYVKSINGRDDKFYNYQNNAEVNSAHKSLETAVRVLAGQNDVRYVKFLIYSVGD